MKSDNEDEANEAPTAEEVVASSSKVVYLPLCRTTMARSARRRSRGRGGKGGRGNEWGAPGWPRVQFSWTFVCEASAGIEFQGGFTILGPD